MRKEDFRHTEKNLRKTWSGRSEGRSTELNMGEVLSAEERGKGLSQHFRTLRFKERSLKL